PPLVSGTMRGVLRATILEKVFSFAMVLGGGGLLLAALVVIAATQWLGSLSLLGHTTGWLLGAASSVILMIITFASMFRFLPPVAIRWRDVWLATLLCAVSWMVASELLALSGVFFGDSRSAYGALGAVLAVMLWMNIVSQVLFFGAELCKVVAMRRGEGGGTCRARHTAKWSPQRRQDHLQGVEEMHLDGDQRDHGHRDGRGDPEERLPAERDETSALHPGVDRRGIRGGTQLPRREQAV